MATASLRLCLVLLVGIPHVCYSQDPQHPGTTPNIEAIFTGRCLDYQEVRYQGLFPSTNVDCSDLWEAFFEAFSYRPPCGVTMKQYEPFLEASRQDLPTDKVLFWSGVYKEAHAYAQSGSRLVTLEDTLLGYMVNSLVWCGQSIQPGMNYTRCPSWVDCPNEASESYWGGASKTFASEARGKVTLILDGSNPSKPAYRRDSFFGKYELPNLSTKDVTGVDVLLVHKLGAKVIDDCKSQNIQMLTSDLQERGFPMTCEDNPDAILFLLCSDDPNNRECQTVQDHMLGNLLPETVEEHKKLNKKPNDLF